ncbi:MAG: sensor histidine kinase [Oligoflexia bacterium]
MLTAKVLPHPASARKFELVFDQASDAIFTVSGSRIDAVNQAFEDLTGFVRSEIEGRGVEIFSPDLREGLHLPERSRPFSLEMLDVPGTYEDVAILRNDGYPRLVDLTVRQADDHYRVVLLRDVTAKKQMERELITKHAELKNAFVALERNNAELKAMQETLVQAGKMAALGELTAGIAHELNQPLQAIRGYGQELQVLLSGPASGAGSERAPPKVQEIQSYLGEMIKGVDKMTAIIKYLRAFTRKSTEGHDFLDLHQVIQDALQLAQAQLESRGITVHKFFSQELPRVYANPVQLEQVFINLATNARDAIEATGRGQGRIEIHTRVSDRLVEVVFKDDGIGMDERTKAKAFNPFFTTKEVGQGMGLGLSLSYGILSKIHATIVVESELGKGASFRIRIPLDYRELA